MRDTAGVWGTGQGVRGVREEGIQSVRRLGLRTARLSRTMYSDIHRIVKAFEPYQQLWTIAHECGQQYPQWHEGLFQLLDPEAVEASVTSWAKTLHRLCRTLKDEAPGQVAVAIRDRLDAFRPHIPLIAALRNPGLGARHWKKISQAVGNPTSMAEDTTLNWILGQNLQAYLTEIQVSWCLSCACAEFIVVCLLWVCCVWLCRVSIVWVSCVCLHPSASRSGAPVPDSSTGTVKSCRGLQACSFIHPR